MSDSNRPNGDWIAERVAELTGKPVSRMPIVVKDTTNFMSIERDQVIDLQGQLFLVRCNERESRYGLEDNPKFWVKRTISLEDGKTYILKLVFQEQFKIRIGTIEIKCSRSEEKEGRVLALVEGDRRFMQGRTSTDSRGNLVRVIDYIRGDCLLEHLSALNLPHEQYFQAWFPEILKKTMGCLRAVGKLHRAALCHGDIRSDHILVERDTGEFRWIDFDLTQDFSDFDVWSVGNILHFTVAKDFVTFREVLAKNPEMSGRFTEDDASVFFPHRVMNLKKVFSCIPTALNDVLMRFSAGTRVYYDRVDQVLDDLGDCAAGTGWPVG